MPRRLPKMKFPEPIDASPEEIARVTLYTPPKRWKYVERRAKQVARRKKELTEAD